MLTFGDILVHRMPSDTDFFFVNFERFDPHSAVAYFTTSWNFIKIHRRGRKKSSVRTCFFWTSCIRTLAGLDGTQRKMNAMSPSDGQNPPQIVHRKREKKSPWKFKIIYALVSNTARISSGHRNFEIRLPRCEKCGTSEIYDGDMTWTYDVDCLFPRL